MNGAPATAPPGAPGADRPLDGRPRTSPWIIALTVMIPTFMEILDTTIVAVALPHMAGSLSASTDEATWVLTSYLVTNAIVLPASGWLALYFGRRRLLIACVAIFTVASFLCGSANSLGMLIAARVLQGAGGGALQPLSQAILLESFPPAKRGAAMAAFGMGALWAPIIGPTLGGWIVDRYAWPWIFYLNLPLGCLAILMAHAYVQDPPTSGMPSLGGSTPSASGSWRSGWAPCRSCSTRGSKTTGSPPSGSAGSRACLAPRWWRSSSGSCGRRSRS